MEESADNGKEWSHSAHADGMNVWMLLNILMHVLIFSATLVSNIPHFKKNSASYP